MRRLIRWLLDRPVMVWRIDGPEGGYSDGYPHGATEDEFLASASRLLGRELRR